MSNLIQMPFRIPAKDKAEFIAAIKKKYSGVKVSASEIIRSLIHNWTEKNK